MILPSLLSNWKLIAAGAGVILLFFVGYRVANLVCEAEKKDSLEAAINNQLEAQERSNATGLDLATGIVKYETKTRYIDKQVNDAVRADNTPRFDAYGMQRTADRIAAGEASRSSIGK